MSTMMPAMEKTKKPEKAIQIHGQLPGPKASAYIERDEAVTSVALGRVFPLVPATGEGSWVTDVDGNVFLDFFAGIATCNTGHRHPAVVEAVEQQLHRIIHAGGPDVYSPLYAELCEKLVSLAPRGSYTGGWEVFLTNSGTESIEGAVKLARYHTRRQRIIAFRDAFHGRSMGSLSLTASKAVQRRGFGPLLSGVTHLRFPSKYDCPADQNEYEWGYSQAMNQFKEIFASLTPADEVAAIIAEPVQGEGGYKIPPAGFFAAIREICDDNDILFIVDEVQSGFGRTGRMFAIEHWGVQPDIICMAKGISSGVPVGGFMSRKSVSTWETSSHGTTWGGNPLGCAAALANIGVIEDEALMQNAIEQGAFLVDRFQELMAESKLLVQVRGLGLMIGLELVDKPTAVEWMQRSFESGVLTLTAGRKSLRLCPPLNLSRREAEIGFGVMRDVLREMEGAEQNR